MITQKQKGYILMSSAIVIGSIGILTAVTLLFFANGFLKNNRSIERSNQAKGLANACAESAIQKVIAISNYTGTDTTTIGQGTCTYTVTDPTASTGLIVTSGTVATVVRKVQVGLKLSPLTVVSWQEVP